MFHCLKLRIQENFIRFKCVRFMKIIAPDREIRFYFRKTRAVLAVFSQLYFAIRALFVIRIRVPDEENKNNSDRPRHLRGHNSTEFFFFFFFPRCSFLESRFADTENFPDAARSVRGVRRVALCDKSIPLPFKRIEKNRLSECLK